MDRRLGIWRQRGCRDCEGLNSEFALCEYGFVRERLDGEACFGVNFDFRVVGVVGRLDLFG